MKSLVSAKNQSPTDTFSLDYPSSPVIQRASAIFWLKLLHPQQASSWTGCSFTTKRDSIPLELPHWLDGSSHTWSLRSWTSLYLNPCSKRNHPLMWACSSTWIENKKSLLILWKWQRTSEEISFPMYICHENNVATIGWNKEFDYSFEEHMRTSFRSLESQIIDCWRQL